MAPGGLGSVGEDLLVAGDIPACLAADALVSLSSAIVRDWTGLMRGGEAASSSLLLGVEVAPVLLVLERLPARGLPALGSELPVALVDRRAIPGLAVVVVDEAAPGPAVRPLEVRV